MQEEQQLDTFQNCQVCCGNCGGFLRIWIPCVFCLCFKFPYIQVQQSTEALLEVFGKYNRTLKPGMHFVNQCVEEVRYVSTKVQILNLNKQTVITKDNITMQIDASVYYKIVDAQKSVYLVENIHDSVRYHTFASIRNVVGQHTLQEFLEKKQEFTQLIMKQTEENVENWGVDVQKIFIKDIFLSPELQRTLSSTALENRYAQAKIISAKADVESAKLMSQAAESLNSNSAMQIRFLETLQVISKSDNQKIIFLNLEDSKKSALG